MCFLLIAVLMGGGSIYLCLLHWIAVVVIVTIILGSFMLVWLVDDYGQGKEKSSLAR